MRISDWSSDVCSSDLLRPARGRWPRRVPHRRRDRGSISMSTSKLSIAGHVIGLDSAPYVVAEAGSNFNQSLDTAKRMIEVAAESGAQADRKGTRLNSSH